MEQEITPDSTAVENKLSTQQIIERLNKITNEIKENTVALVEMGIAVKKLENTVQYLLNKGAVRG